MKPCTELGFVDDIAPVAKIDLEVRRVRNEALSYHTSSLFEPFVNNMTVAMGKHVHCSGRRDSEDLSGHAHCP